MAIKAGALNFDRLLAFANDFATGPGCGRRLGTLGAACGGIQPPHRRGPPNGHRDRSRSRPRDDGALTLDTLAGKARLTARTMSLAPIAFGVFGGRYDGSLVFTLGAVPDFRLNARLAGVDMAAASAFAGSPDTITGRLSGTLNLTGRGMNTSSVMSATRGTARVDIVNGIVKNLGLIRSVVVATSGRADAAGAGGGTRDEPFTKLGATWTLAGGSASTDDLRFDRRICCSPQPAPSGGRPRGNQIRPGALSDALYDRGAGSGRYTHRGRVTCRDDHRSAMRRTCGLTSCHASGPSPTARKRKSRRR